ncbi:MAG: hypothetical protein K2M95_07960 [Clostridiales bacterium]|nr:hypothetical protein [Clostridiales bacterium]
MNKSEKIRLLYSILVGVFSVAMGIALICVAADIYYSGRGTGVVFSRAIVAKRLKMLAIPFILLVGVIACGAIFPLYEVKAKPTPENAVRLLSEKVAASGKDEEYDEAAKKYKTLKLARLIVWCGAFSVALICAISSLCYLLKTANFKGENITAEIFAMVRHVLPCVAVSFLVLVAAAITNGILAKQQVSALKTMLKHGDKSNASDEPQKPLKWYQKVLRALSTDLALWITRGAVFCVAVVFIIVGALNGGAHDVMIKAVNICTECIGLG